MIITYQQQHATILSGLGAKIQAANWHQVSEDAGDLYTLEVLLGQTPPNPAPVTATTVMVKPLGT